MQIVDCGAMEFDAAYQLQEELVQEIAAGACPETLLVLEHPEIFTMGIGGNMENVLDPAIRVARTNRGGDVTWHGPGQLVVYPLVNIGDRGRDLHLWLRFLERLLIRTAGRFGVEGFTVPGRTGVWTKQGKLASIGIGVRRWISMHGFALNVDPDLSRFTLINPCGIRSCPMTSLAREARPVPEMSELKASICLLFPQLLDEILPKTVSPEPNTAAREELSCRNRNHHIRCTP